MFVDNSFLKTLHTVFHFVSPLHSGWRGVRDELDIRVKLISRYYYYDFDASEGVLKVWNGKKIIKMTY